MRRRRGEDGLDNSSLLGITDTAFEVEEKGGFIRDELEVGAVKRSEEDVDIGDGTQAGTKSSETDFREIEILEKCQGTLRNLETLRVFEIGRRIREKEEFKK